MKYGQKQMESLYANSLYGPEKGPMLNTYLIKMVSNIILQIACRWEKNMMKR